MCPHENYDHDDDGEYKIAYNVAEGFLADIEAMFNEMTVSSITLIGDFILNSEREVNLQNVSTTTVNQQSSLDEDKEGEPDKNHEECDHLKTEDSTELVKSFQSGIVKQTSAEGGTVERQTNLGQDN